MQSVNKEKQNYFGFYSKQKDFVFSINIKEINDKKIAIRVHERSKAIKLNSAFFIRQLILIQIIILFFLH